jgi:hypothetical protein
VLGGSIIIFAAAAAATCAPRKRERNPDPPHHRLHGSHARVPYLTSIDDALLVLIGRYVHSWPPPIAYKHSLEVALRKSQSIYGNPFNAVNTNGKYCVVLCTETRVTNRKLCQYCFVKLANNKSSGFVPFRVSLHHLATIILSVYVIVLLTKGFLTKRAPYITTF